MNFKKIYVITGVCQNDCFVFYDVNNGTNGINNEIIFMIMFDLLDGQNAGPEQAIYDDNQQYRMELNTLFDYQVYVETIMSVNDKLVFDLTTTLSGLIGSGDLYSEYSFNKLTETICKNSSLSPSTKLNSVLERYKDAMRELGYNVV